MKTPYDAAVRWRKSELDLLRRQVAALLNRRALVDAESAVLERQFVAEEAVSKHQPLLNFARFATLNRQERTKLQHEIDRIDADIAEFQERLASAFQDFKALDMAARTHVLTAERKMAAQDQAELDEIAARKVVLFAR